MTHLASMLRAPRLVFLAGAGFIVTASWLVLHGAVAARRPELVSAAVAFDLTVTATFLAWLTLVRPGVAGPMTLATVFAAGAALAARWAPAAPRPAALVLTAAGELAFLGVVGARAVRLRRSWKRIGRSLPPEDAFRQAARAALGSSVVVDALATEAAMIWLAVASWRRQPDVPRGAVPFANHRSSSYGAVVVAILLAGVAETAALHLLVARWNDRWAWGATALGLYAIVWLVGDWRAVVLRPAFVARDVLEVRVGLRWRATIPLAHVRTVCVGPGARGHRGALRLSPVGPANLFLHLTAPVEVDGLFGRRKRSALLGLRVDEPESLANALRGR